MLHDKAQDAIRAPNVSVGEMTANLPERREQKWHLARQKDRLPSVLSKIEEWLQWKEYVEDYADAVSCGTKDI